MYGQSAHIQVYQKVENLQNEMISQKTSNLLTKWNIMGAPTGNKGHKSSLIFVSPCNTHKCKQCHIPHHVSSTPFTN